MNFKERFTYVYDNKVWGEGSGGGSNPENNTEYILFLQDFLKEKEIKSVVDFGCGDWQFSQLIDWSAVDYLGIDCVKSVITENRVKFPNQSFYLSDEIPEKVKGRKRVDLLILKDVLQHWTNESIVSFINKNLSRFKYILIINSKGSVHWQHHEQMSIITRPITALEFPLNLYNIEVLRLLEQNPNDIKEISLITRK